MSAGVLELLAVLGGSVIASLITSYFLQRRAVEDAKAKLLTDVVAKHKSDSEAADLLVRATAVLIEPLYGKITEQQKEIDELRKGQKHE
jgi:NAD/NADP transhydrogenase beta subunit